MTGASDRFPLTYEHHWDILDGYADGTVAFQVARDETIDALAEVLGIPLTGDVVDVNGKTLGVAFDLAVAEDDVSAFPYWDDDRGNGASYWVTGATIRTGHRDMDGPEDVAENTYAHRIRMHDDVAQAVKGNLYDNGIWLEEDSSGHGYRLLKWTDEYVEQMDDRLAGLDL